MNSEHPTTVAVFVNPMILAAIKNVIKDMAYDMITGKTTNDVQALYDALDSLVDMAKAWGKSTQEATYKTAITDLQDALNKANDANTLIQRNWNNERAYSQSKITGLQKQYNDLLAKYEPDEQVDITLGSYHLVLGQRNVNELLDLIKHSRWIMAIKCLRKVTGLGLKEAKDLVEQAEPFKTAWAKVRAAQITATPTPTSTVTLQFKVGDRVIRTGSQCAIRHGAIAHINLDQNGLKDHPYVVDWDGGFKGLSYMACEIEPEPEAQVHAIPLKYNMGDKVRTFASDCLATITGVRNGSHFAYELTFSDTSRGWYSESAFSLHTAGTTQSA